MNKLKIGVIGTGHLGKLHTKMFKSIKNCLLIGVYDLNEGVAKKVASEFGCKQFNSLDELLNSVDAVSIAVPTVNHYDIAKYSLEKRKHIFLEKPITATIEQAEELVNIANENNLKIQVGHIERFNPALLSVESFINEPKFIQTDRLAQFNPRGTDVTVVLDLMIHDIDIILSLINSPVKDIQASGTAVVSDSVDIANARIQFENGAVANVTASRISQKKMRKMRLFQKDSYISLDFTSGVSEIYRLIPLTEKPPLSSFSFGEIGIDDKKKRVIYQQPEVKEINALQYELSLFVDAVMSNTKPVVSGVDGLRALKIADKIIAKISETKV